MDTRLKIIVGFFVVLAVYAGGLVPLQAQIQRTPGLKAIIVQAAIDPSMSREERSILGADLSDPAHMEGTVVDYLSSKLGKDVSVIGWTKTDASNRPSGEGVMLVRLDYTTQSHVIEGKSTVLGSLAIHTNRNFNQGQFCFDQSDYSFLPLGSFVIEESSQRTRQNLKAAVADVLATFTMVRHSKPNE